MSGSIDYLGQPVTGSNPYLNVPATNIPLSDSPFPSCAPSPEPMFSVGVNPSQPPYVTDLTHMLVFMNQNHLQFQEQVTQVISLLTSSHEPTSMPQGSQGSNNIKLHNPHMFNGQHKEVVPFLSEVQ